MSPGTALAPDAAITLGLASTALPFARTPEAEIERWLRVLRLHGQVGIALQALGVSEAPLADDEGPRPAQTSHTPGPAVDEATGRGHRSDAGQASAHDAGESARSDTAVRDVVALVTERALRVAWERQARALATTDVLLAVMDVYGEDFDRALQAHGTDRDELLHRLKAAAGPAPA